MLPQYIQISEEIKEALSSQKGVVALESTIIAHGLPYPQNVETALEVERIIRNEGAVPATIAVIDGAICIGLTPAQIEAIGNPKQSQKILKLSRRDLPYAIAMQCTGATTVAATMICAALAKIAIFVTGGIGGVHRHGESTLDISADLHELAKTNVAVVCSGAKSILDIEKTLEVLETLGVPVIGYQTQDFPEFYCSKGAFLVDYRMDHVEEIAKMLNMKWQLGLKGGVVVANAIPQASALDNARVERFIADALLEAEKCEVRGKEITPFLLSAVSKKSEGETLQANLALIKNNAKLGAHLSKAFSIVQKENPTSGEI